MGSGQIAGIRAASGYVVIVRAIITLCIISFTSHHVYAQTSGDFRTKTSGNWSDLATWQTYNGATWVDPASKPGSANNVYIQSGHTVTLTGDEACNDFNFCRGSTVITAPGSVALGDYTLSVSGQWRAYNGAVNTIPGTTSNGQLGAYPFTSTGGKFSFVGSSRNMVVASSSSSTAPASIGSTVLPLSIDMTAGETLTLNGGFIMTSCEVNSGIFDIAAANFRLNTGTTGQGDLTIASGARLKSSKSGPTTPIFSRTGSAGSRAGTLTISAGGVLELSGQTPTAEMNACFLNGIVEYTRAGPQTLLALPTSPDASAASISTYGGLYLGSSGVKTQAVNTTVNGNLTLAGTSSLGLGGFTLTYGASAALEYAGSSAQTTSNNEFPASGVPNVIFNNASGVTLNAGKTVSGSATIHAGSTLADGGFTLNISGNVTNAGTVSGSGKIYLNGSSVQTISGGGGFGNLELNNTAGATLGSGITVNGTLTVSTGMFSDGGYILTAKGNVVNSGGMTSSGSGKLVIGGSSNQNIGGGTYGNIEFNNPGAVALLSSATDIVVPSSFTFTVGSDGTVKTQNKGITGAGNLTIQNGGTFIFGNGTAYSTGTASGAIRVSGVRTFGAQANYVIAGYGGNCSMGAGFPSPVNNLTIDLSGGSGYTATLQSSIQVRGTLTVTTGLFRQNGNAITVGNLGGAGDGLEISSSSVTVTNGGSYAATISGSGALIKSGSGTLNLYGTNTYSGNTTLNGGVVALAGEGSSIGSSATITVGGGSVLTVTGRTDRTITLANPQYMTGGGSVTGNVVINGGRLGAIGVLDVSSLTMMQGTFELDFVNAAGLPGVSGWDMIRVGAGAGNITNLASTANAVTVRIARAQTTLPGFDGTSSMSFKIVDGGSVAGFDPSHFAVDDSLFVPTSLGGSWSISSVNGDVVLDYSPGDPVDLAITSSSTPGPVPVDDIITYTITVTNNSNYLINTYYVTNRLNAGMVYLGSSDSGTESGGTVRWTLSNLPANGSKTITMTARCPFSGAFSVISEVWPLRSEADPSNNSTTNLIQAYCPSAGVAGNNAPASLTATNNQPISFTITSSNQDCDAPRLLVSGLPSGATFPVVTNEYSVSGTFTWTPSGGPGTYFVRFYSFNETKPTSTVTTVIHVDNSGAPQTAGIWDSQTNWSVSITSLQVPSSGNITLSWDAVNGISYDVYTSAQPLGGNASWSKAVDGQLATGASCTAAVSAVSAGSARYYQVVPQNASRTDRGIWGVVRPSIPSALHLMSPPLVSDRSFADNGAFGQALAAVVPDGTQVQIATDGTPSWVVLEKSGSVWRTEPGNEAYNTPLNPGQAFFIQGASGAVPTFSGSVGNNGTQSLTIVHGYNLIGVSEGKGLAPATAFSVDSMDPDPVGADNRDDADQIIIQHLDGSWRRLVRQTDGSWYDMRSPGTTSVILKPGEAYYYLRRNSTSTVGF